MNKLSIILSMFVAVAVAAIAAVVSPMAANDPTQGYWITLSQVQTAGTSQGLDDVCYLQIVTNQAYPVNAMKEETPTDASFWHAETVPNNDAAYYLKNNRGGYLAVTLDKFQAAAGAPLQYFYKVAVASSTAQAAQWSIGLGSTGDTEITLVAPDAATLSKVEAIEEPNIKPDNIYVAMSQKNGTVHMCDAAGHNPQWTQEVLGTLTTSWSYKTAELWYDAAFDAKEADINALWASTFWDNTSVNDNARKTIDGLRTNYTAIRGASARPATAIANMEKQMEQVYNTVYASAGRKVITLTATDGALFTDGKTLSWAATPNNLGSLWTIAYQNGGYVIQNQTEGRYITLIPRVNESYNQWMQPVPAVPAHFGLGTQPTVFTLKPANGGIQLYTGKQPFYLNDYAGGEELSEEATPVTFTATGLTAAEVSDIVVSDPNSQFATEKQVARDLLSQLAAIMPVQDEANVYTAAAESLERLSGTITIGPNTTPEQVLTAAKQQLAQIANVVNSATLTPMLVNATANGSTCYLSASASKREVYDSFGNIVKVDIADARMTLLDATARTQRLATAMWVMEYQQGGKFTMVNSEGIYLTAPLFNNDVQTTLNATAKAEEATLFTLTNFSTGGNGQGGTFQITYSEGEGTNVISFSTGTAEQPVTFDTFGFADTMLKPETCQATTDAEGTVVPDGTPAYYQIASIGGGGVITAVLPGDALSHAAGTIGSYWWFELDQNDPINDNAYIIHSIYPGYYLGADLAMTEKPCTWYISPNGIEPASNPNTSSAFNGHNAGMTIATTAEATRGRVLAAAPYTNDGQPNPALQTTAFNRTSWQLQSWMFVAAPDAETIVGDYVRNNMHWQVQIAKEGLAFISNQTPFGSNAFGYAASLLEEFDPQDMGTNAADQLKKIIEFNSIIATAQNEFDAEVLQNAGGRLVKIVNEGAAMLDFSPNTLLAGTGANLSLLPYADNTKASEWTVGVNGDKGITFANGNRQGLGTPNANGTVSSYTGTYRLAINMWWEEYEMETINGETYFNPTGAVSPWYAVPASLVNLQDEDLKTQYYNQSAHYGLGLENALVPGIGLAAAGNGDSRVIASGMLNPYAQWSIRTYNPTPEPPSGIEDVEAEGSEAAETGLFTLDGRRIERATAAPGIYLSRRADGTAIKVVIR